MTPDLTLHPTVTSPVEYRRPKGYADAAAEMEKMHGLGVACVAVEHGAGNHVIRVYRTPEALREQARR